MAEVVFRTIKSLNLAGSPSVGTTISNKYFHLLIVGMARSSVAAESAVLRMYINNDNTLANYLSSSYGGTNATWENAESSDARLATISGGNSPTGAFGTFKLWIYNYNSNAIVKCGLLSYVSYLSGTLNSIMGVNTFQWNSINPITRLDFVEAGSNNFATGSLVKIYGVGNAP